MQHETWQQLLSFESRDLVSMWFKKIHGRELNARRAKEITAAAKQARIQGVVRLKVLVGKDGKVESVSVIEGHPLLRSAAMDAAKQWVYKATVLNGAPVEVQTEAEVNFTLSK